MFVWVQNVSKALKLSFSFINEEKSLLSANIFAFRNLMLSIILKPLERQRASKMWTKTQKYQL